MDRAHFRSIYQRITAVPWLSLAAGLVTSTAFPPWDFAPGALLGPLMLFCSLRGFSSGFLYGVGLLAPQTYWLFSFTPIGPFGVILLSSLAYGAARSADRGSSLLFAALMTSAELVRSSGTFAFPWGVVGSSSAGIMLRSWAPIMGIWGISFSIYFVAAELAKRRARALVFLAVLLIPAFLWPPAAHPIGESVRVGIVQGNFPPERDYYYEREDVIALHLLATRDLAARGAEIVLWTETVILEYLNEGRQMDRMIDQLAVENGIVLIVGAPSRIGARIKRNSAFVYDGRNLRDGRSAVRRYDKHHLVPFGEFIPGYGPDRTNALLPEGTGDFSPAPIPLAIDAAAIAICYEGALSNVVRELVRQDARMIVNLSNDAFSYSSVEARQHADLARMRAAELRIPVVRAGNVGPSFIADHGGEVVTGLPEYRTGIVLGDVILSKTSFSLTYLWGDWIGWLSLLGSALCLTVRGLVAEDVMLE